MSSKINNKNTIDNILNHIVKEKDKVEKMTKKLLNTSKKTSISNNKHNSTKKIDINKIKMENLVKMSGMSSTSNDDKKRK